MWRLISAALLASASLAGTGASSAQARDAAEGVTVTYLANEGVLLSSGGRRVLIDALFERYGPEYSVPADSTQRALALAQSPFDSIDLILVTHRHGDHFHPAPVNSHLDANPHTTLLTSRQVIDSLHRPLTTAAPSSARILARTTTPRARQRVVVAGIPVHLLGLPHGGGRRQRHIEHLGFIVELGGRRVLHVGDAELTEATLAPFRLDTARIDVALLPFWALQDRETRRVIERWIRPRQIVAFHLPEGRAARIARELETVLPSVVTFGRSLDTHRW